MKELLIVLIEVIYIVVIIFILIGCFLPTKYLKYHLLALPLLMIHWQINDNRCILSDIEYKIKNIPISRNLYHGNPIFKGIFNKVGFNVSDYMYHVITIGMVSVAWLGTYNRVITKCTL